MSSLQVSVGPVLFLWEQPELARFYHQVADSPADIVYLGETVCGKRRLSKWKDYLDWGRMLNESGKQVVLSTMALIESSAQLSELKRLCDNSEFLFEANDVATVGLLNARKMPFVVGPGLNVYNGYTLAKLSELGAVRWTMPVELSGDWLKALKQEYQSICSRPMEFEVFSYGLMPLAYSARCFTARYHNRQKDECELICRSHPQGILLRSQESQSLFTLNGIQTMSGEIYNLCEDVVGLAQTADVARVSVQTEQELEWIEVFKSDQKARRPDGHINGYWHQLAGMAVA